MFCYCSDWDLLTWPPRFPLLLRLSRRLPTVDWHYKALARSDFHAADLQCLIKFEKVPDQGFSRFPLAEPSGSRFSGGTLFTNYRRFQIRDPDRVFQIRVSRSGVPDHGFKVRGSRSGFPDLGGGGSRSEFRVGKAKPTMVPRNAVMPCC